MINKSLENKMDDRIYFYEKETISLSKIITDGIILDIGGGGEGIIGKINGKNVLSIDRLKEELEEVENDAIKIVMDASDLKLLDNSIDIVTSFFTLMYINKEKINIVFSEMSRVLKNNGKLYIWDIIIERNEENKDIVCVPVDIKINNKLIHVDYGVNWKNNEQNKDMFLKIATEVGLSLIKDNSIGKRIELEFIKKI
jgi:SAM-dependent methyltransferase